MKVYEHQVQRSHNSAEFLNGCIWQDDNSSIVQIMVIFRHVKAR